MFNTNNSGVSAPESRSDSGAGLFLVWLSLVSLMGVSIVYSVNGSRSYLLGFSSDNRVLWSRVYEDQISVSASNGSVWATEKDKALELGSAIVGSVDKENKQNIDLLKTDPKTLSKQNAYKAYTQLLDSYSEYEYYALVDVNDTGIPAILTVRNDPNTADKYGVMVKASCSEQFFVTNTE